MDNLQLYKKLEIIVKYNMQPEDVSVLITEAPIVNTLKEGDKASFLMADVVTEGSLQQDIRSAKHVMYWKVADEEKAVEVVGIAWFSDVKMTLFTGSILEP